jgi:hypothetical protein
MTTWNATPEPNFLRNVTVRLIRPEERERFDQLLEERHYLHSARLGGQSLRYVAEVDGECPAISWVGFNRAATGFSIPNGGRRYELRRAQIT